MRFEQYVRSRLLTLTPFMLAAAKSNFFPPVDNSFAHKKLIQTQFQLTLEKELLLGVAIFFPDTRIN